MRVPVGCYCSAMRRSVAVLVLAAFVAGACSGSDEASSTDPPDPTVTSAPSTTDVDSTTTTVVVTTTNVETTIAPTTTVDDEARLRAAEEAYIAAWEAYHAAILDPSDPELRAEVERTNTGSNLEAALMAIDGFVEANYVARPHPELLAEVSILSEAMPVPDEPDLVDLIACEINSEAYFEVGSAPDGGDALVRDEVVVLRLLVRLRLVDGEWKTDSGEILSRRRLVVFILAVAPVMQSAPPDEGTVPEPIPDTVFASGESGGSTNQPLPTIEVDVDGEAGSIGVEVVLPAGAESSTGRGTVRPRCSWEKALVGDFRDAPGGIPGEGERSTDQVTELGPGGEVQHLGWWKTCIGSDPAFVWLTPTVDMQALIDGAAARARAATPTPIPNINPAPAAGSFVNLGLWLAIDDPGVTTARVALGGEWAQVRAVHSGFEVDFGNGDSVACELLGTPILDLEIVEEGPCGYTYRLSSPEDEPYVVRITSTYDVTYTTSTGRSGSLGELNRSTSFDYDIDEIQTVGVSN